MVAVTATGGTRCAYRNAVTFAMKIGGGIVALLAFPAIAYGQPADQAPPGSPSPPPIGPSPPAAPSEKTSPSPDASKAAAAAPIDVTVTGDALPASASLVEGHPLAASDSSTGQAQLSLRPRARTEGIVENVPGLFAVQHAGGGKSDQYFMRGFNLDHGTDAAQFVDGVPINAVSHGHGQGYSDIHFLIPEFIDTLESTKGPYSARVGDFATAGSIAYRMADHLDESVARAEVGQYGHYRAVAGESPDLGEHWRMLVGAEITHDDGPFIHPDNFNRVNGYGKFTHIFDDRSEASLEVMAYGGSWNMSGVLPARAVCGESDGNPAPTAYAGSHCISRWDSIDPSQGGATQRFMALATYHRPIERGDLETSVYALHSNLQLFPNDGIAASFQPAGIQYGSQVEQDDTRTQAGANTRLTKRFKVGPMDVEATAGLQIRYDNVTSALDRDEQRVRLDGLPGIPGPIVDSLINETEIGAYVEADWRPIRWMRFNLGARLDRVDVTVSNESSTAVDKVAGYQGAMQVSPKATVAVYPVKWLDLFANYGRGFHTNDGRTLIEGQSTTLIVKASGYEAGAVVRPFKGLSISGVAFLLDLDSELTIDGDTASTSPSAPTRRLGGEFSARFEFLKNVFADASFAVTRARYTDAADVAAGTTLVELAPIRTFSAGVGVRQPVGPIVLIGSAQVRSMSDRPATADGKLIATGFTVVDASAGIRWKFVELGGDLINIANTEYREGQFEVQSRLPGEGPNPPDGISFTPGLPRMFIGHAQFYW